MTIVETALQVNVRGQPRPLVSLTSRVQRCLSRWDSAGAHNLLKWGVVVGRRPLSSISMPAFFISLCALALRVPHNEAVSSSLISTSYKRDHHQATS